MPNNFVKILLFIFFMFVTVICGCLAKQKAKKHLKTETYEYLKAKDYEGVIFLSHDQHKWNPDFSNVREFELGLRKNLFGLLKKEIKNNIQDILLEI